MHSSSFPLTLFEIFLFIYFVCVIRIKSAVASVKKSTKTFLKNYKSISTYIGRWKDDLREGLGIFRTEAGVEYVGEWEGGVKHGFGILVHANGEVCFDFILLVISISLISYHLFKL